MDAAAVRNLLHAIGDDRGQLHDLLVQSGVFFDIVLNAIAVVLQLLVRCLELADEILISRLEASKPGARGYRDR